ISILFQAISQKSRFFRANLRKISIFSGNFIQNSDFSWQISEKYRFSPGKNWLFTAISGQSILFLFKSHHFRTYFLYMIKYNNILRPVHDPPCPKSGGHDYFSETVTCHRWKKADPIPLSIECLSPVC